MKRISRLESDPAKTRDWQQRSRANAASKRRNRPAPSPEGRTANGLNRAKRTPQGLRGAKQGGISSKPVTPAKRADIKFSLMIREAAGWLCARCRKDHSQNHAGLEASHFYNVRYSAVRYDPDNVIPLCGRFSSPNCHTGSDGWEFQKGLLGAYHAFMAEKLGSLGMLDLKLKAYSHVKLRDAVEAFIGGEAR